MESGTDRPYRRSVLRGTVATGVGNGWAMVLGLVTLPILLNRLGSDAFGLWVLLQTFSATSGWLSLGDLGLTTSVTRYVAADLAESSGAESARLAGSALSLCVLLGVAWGAALALVGPTLLTGLFQVPDDLVDDFRAALAWLGLMTAADFFIRGALAVLDGAQRVEWSRSLDMGRRTLATGGATVAALAGAGLAGTAAASALGTVVAAGVTLRYLHRLPELRVGRPHLASARRLLRFGSTVALLRPLGVIHRTMDRIIIGAALGPGAVTLVEIATQIQNGAEAVLGASSYAVAPSAAWLEGSGAHHRVRELVITGTRYTLIATLPVVVVTALLAGPAITVWLSAAELDAAGLAVLALAYTAVTAPLQVGSTFLVGTGRVAPVFRAAAAGLTVNLVLSLVLVGPLGSRGVFLATLISGLAIVPLLAHAILGAVDVTAMTFLRESVLPPAVAAGVIGVFVAVPVLLPLPAFATLLAGGAVAVGVGGLVIPRLAMTPGELGNLLRTLRRPVEAAT